MASDSEIHITSTPYPTGGRQVYIHMTGEFYTQCVTVLSAMEGNEKFKRLVLTAVLTFVERNPDSAPYTLIKKPLP